MGKLDNLKRIILEDFPSKDRDTVEKLSVVLNSFMENVYNILDNRVDFDNLNQEVVTVNVTVDGSGVPTTTTKFSSDIVDRAQGAIVIYASNLTDGSLYPTSGPFLSFEPLSTNLYKVNNVSGLQAANKYQLKVLLIGK